MAGSARCPDVLFADCALLRAVGRRAIDPDNRGRVSQTSTGTRSSSNSSASRTIARLFSDPQITASLYFTILYAVATTVIVTVIAIPLAVIVNIHFFGHKLVRAVFFFTSVPSLLVLALVWAYILSPLGSGVINYLLYGLFGARTGAVALGKSPSSAVGYNGGRLGAGRVAFSALSWLPSVGP